MFQEVADHRGGVGCVRFAEVFVFPGHNGFRTTSSGGSVSRERVDGASGVGPVGRPTGRRCGPVNERRGARPPRPWPGRRVCFGRRTAPGQERVRRIFSGLAVSVDRRPVAGRDFLTSCGKMSYADLKQHSRTLYCVACRSETAKSLSTPRSLERATLW